MTTQEITGFGRDTWCGSNGLQTGRFAAGVVLLAQACYHRLCTPRGTLAGGDDEKNYGIDLSEYVGAVGEAVAIAALPSVIRGELLKDDRVSDVDTTITSTRDADGLVHLYPSIAVEAADGSGVFPLTLDVSRVGVVMLGSPS